MATPYTTFGVGGGAKAVLVIKRPEELVEAIVAAQKNRLPYRLIAGGSNVVFSDKLFNGLLIIFRDNNDSKLHHTYHCQGQTLTVEASAPLAGLIKGAIKNNLAGLEALSGIPGTVGGAIIGNAGAYGQSISDHLIAVEVFDPNVKCLTSNTKWFTRKQCKFRYRDSIFKHKELIVLRAKFELVKGDKKELAEKSRQIIKTRNQKYPPGLKCPGSFFKNIVQLDGSKIPAGKLLEEVGAKGMRQGGIYVASYHGNLLINDGTGTYTDVKKLAAKLKWKVFKKFGIKLEEEVRYVV